MIKPSWYRPHCQSSETKGEIRISNNYININSFCVKNYFKNKPKARVAYIKEKNILIIKPTRKIDKYGFKLVHPKNENLAYLSSKGLIKEECLNPPKGVRSLKYNCSWDEENKWIVVENVKKMFIYP